MRKTFSNGDFLLFTSHETVIESLEKYSKLLGFYFLLIAKYFTIYHAARDFLSWKDFSLRLSVRKQSITRWPKYSPIIKFSPTVESSACRQISTASRQFPLNKCLIIVRNQKLLVKTLAHKIFKLNEIAFKCSQLLNEGR